MNEWVIVGIIAVAVIFGATKLPELARNVGRAQGEFKKGLKEGATDADQPATPPSQAAAQQPPVEQPPPQQG
jgi:sec-independent protein translocase protein TatA